MPDDGRYRLRVQKADKKLTVGNYMLVFYDVSGCPKIRHASAEDAAGRWATYCAAFPERMLWRLSFAAPKWSPLFYR